MSCIQQAMENAQDLAEARRREIVRLERELARALENPGCEGCPKECEYPPGWTAGLEEAVARMSARILQLNAEVARLTAELVQLKS